MLGRTSICGGAELVERNAVQRMLGSIRGGGICNCCACGTGTDSTEYDEIGARDSLTAVTHYDFLGSVWNENGYTGMKAMYPLSSDIPIASAVLEKMKSRVSPRFCTSPAGEHSNEVQKSSRSPPGDGVSTSSLAREHVTTLTPLRSLGHTPLPLPSLLRRRISLPTSSPLNDLSLLLRLQITHLPALLLLHAHSGRRTARRRARHSTALRRFRGRTLVVVRMAFVEHGLRVGARVI